MIFIFLLSACSKNEEVSVKEKYIFVKTYCTQVTVGGFIGITKKCFNVGDVVEGEEKTNGVITIRIADHSEINDGPPSPNSYQEFLDVPCEYLEKTKQ